MDQERGGKEEETFLRNEIANEFLTIKKLAEQLGDARDFQPVNKGTGYTESDFIREAAWVILCSGFRERIIRALFSKISICFCNWASASAVSENAGICRLTALDVFNNVQKIDSIIDMCEKLAVRGFPYYERKINNDPLEALTEFRFIGPVTSYHLAKNLGFNLGKPDRHLEVLAKRADFRDSFEMCSCISSLTEYPLSVVDGVLWRLSEQKQTLHINFVTKVKGIMLNS